MRRTILLSAVLFLAAAVPASAQTIDPGMTRAQVVELLGRPFGERSTGPRTFLFYRNGCERSCGMHDLVVLEGDAVVDAIFRAAGRRYSGESSSPAPVPPRRAARGASRRASRGALPAGTARGGIVVGNPTAADGAPAPAARRSVRAAAGAPPASQPPASAGADAARARRQPGGDVRVPIVPRDTQVGVPPRERGKRTLPGPVIVPTTPRDAQVGRPDSGGARRTPPPRPAPAQSPPRPDSSTSTSSPR